MAQGLVVQGDLDRDLDYTGDVTVDKNIPPGRRITVRGNLSVGGDVQGSRLVVEGHLTVKGRIVSGAEGAVAAGGRVSAQALDHASLECGQSLSVEGSIVASRVKSKASIEAGGAIEGGEALARHFVRALRIGTVKGVETRVGAGIDFKLIEVLEEMEKEIAGVAEKVNAIKSAVNTLERKELTYNKIPYQEKKLLAATRPSLEILERQMEGLAKSRKKLERKLAKTVDSFVEVGEKVFPNTHLSVRNRLVVTQRELAAGKYTLREGKIYRVA